MVAATQDLMDGPWAAAAAAAAAAGSSQASSSRVQPKQQQQHTAGSNSSSSSSSLSLSVRDVYADFNQLTLNITLAALFGLKDSSSYTSSSSTGSSSSSSSRQLTDSETAARVVSAVERAFTYFAARGATAMVVPEWVPTPDNVAFKEAVQQLDDLVYGIIDARQAENSKQRQGADAILSSSSSSSSRTDLLQALLDSTDEAGRPMAKTALRDELMTLLVAGQEVRVVRQ
jgi:cytochrome P450